MISPGCGPRCTTEAVGPGYPPPETQLAVYNEYGVLIGEVDMGWPDLRIAVEYEGDHHRTSRRQFTRDIHKYDELIEQGWIVIRITAADPPAVILGRIADAWKRRVKA